MKNILLACISLIILVSCGANKYTQAEKNDTGAYIAPGYEKKKYKKIMVIAMLREPIYRKRVEKAVVEELAARNFNMVASTDIFTDEMMKDTAKIRQTAIDAGVDAAIVLTSLGTNSQTVNRAEFDGSFYGWYGMAFAVIDVSSSSANVNYMQMDFIVEDKLGSQYRVALPINTTNNSEVALETLGLTARNRLLDDKIL